MTTRAGDGGWSTGSPGWGAASTTCSNTTTRRRPRRSRGSFVEGDILRRLDGRYGFEAEGEGTRVTYDLAIDVAIPMPGLIKRRAAGMIMGTALRELKKEAER